MLNSDFNSSDSALSQRADELLRVEIGRWAEATMRDQGDREVCIAEKAEAVGGFFSVTGRHPQEVRPPDVRIWCDALEKGGRTASAIRDYVGLLSSFFEWLMKAPRPELSVPQNPVKVARTRSAKEASADDWVARAEGLFRRIKSLRVGDSVNFRDFSMEDLDELNELIQYKRKQLISLETPAEVAACEDVIANLIEFGVRLKKLRIMYMLVAMRAVREVNRKRGELGNWDMVIEELRAARPSWGIPSSESFTPQWLEKLDALLIDSLNRRLTRTPRTRLASSPIAREGFIRFPSERIFKAALEALMPGAMLAGPPLHTAMESLTDHGRQIGDRLEAAYVFKSKRGDFEGAIGFPHGTDPALRQALQNMPSLAVKALFALWARLYAELSSPAHGETISMSVSQFCDDLGYKRKRGSHEPENRRQAVLILRALMTLEALVTYKPDQRELHLGGTLFHRSRLSLDIKGYSDVFSSPGVVGAGEVHGVEAFTYGPGATHANPIWRARNTSVAFASEGLLRLGAGNKDRWAVLVGGYIASLAGMNGYRERPLNARTLLEKTGLFLEGERHRKIGRMQDKLENALERLQEIGFIESWNPIADESEQWRIEKLEIRWPDALRKRAGERDHGRKHHRRSERRKRAAGTRAKYAE